MRSEALPRQRTDTPAAWVLPDPPPIPDLSRYTPQRTGHGDIMIRVADPDTDASLVAEWMSQPHLIATWQQPWPASQWARYWVAQLSGTYSVPVIMLYQGVAVGYLEIYRAGRDEVGRCYHPARHDLGFHIAVGDPHLTGRRIFSPFLPTLADAMLEADPLCQVVIVDPAVNNTRMHQALLNNGWRGGGEAQPRPDRRIRLFYRGSSGLDPVERGLS